MDPALLAGVDENDDDNTSLAGVQVEGTSLAGVPIHTTTVTANDDEDNLDAESDHNSVDPNKANNNSSKASIHSTRGQTPVHSTIDEPPQLPPEEDEPDDMDNTQLPDLETQVPILCQSERVSVLPSDYIPRMGGKTYAMNMQTENSQDKDKGLVYNHDKARVLNRSLLSSGGLMEDVSCLDRSLDGC